MFRWWALPASVVTHLLIVALLIFGLPVSLSPSQEEQAIAVELVPPPKPPEKAKVEPPPPAKEAKSEKAQEASAEASSPTGNDSAGEPPPSALRPVFQFGEKDTGPREAPDGNSADEGSASPVARLEPDKKDLAEPPPVKAFDAIGAAPQSEAPEVPTPKPTDVAKVQSAVKLQKAKKLFSQAASGNPTATTAMRNVPRDVRAGRLCVTELREQLLNASPPYFPDLLPSERLKDGTVIEIPREAFRANGQWFNLSYRCEVDADAMKVVSFAFNVGDPVPRSEWKRRGLPAQ
ncbi:DUF930 domain-containing protein [Mesorhizobium sp. CGMCC 1.15528]|uniref:DUF930 domain-containing protein n=1 Tax=Mesorhizobium zhangyense TaxID=1776730 RepID=A0A7C9R450_9HYPH|nr:DUF930 domain-containing protein [Mesorhizobium zhangyense]